METNPDQKTSGGAAKEQAPELRLLDRRAFVGFPSLVVSPGLVISDFALQIPDVTFPFSISGGALRYQRRKLQFGFLEVSLEAELVSRKVAALAEKLIEIEDLKLHFRPGYLEGQARMPSGERAPLTFKIAFDGDGERLAVYVYDVRFYGFSPTPSARIPSLIARTILDLDLMPEVELRGATGFTSRVLPPLVQIAAVSRGYRMPDLEQARLAGVEISSRGLRLRFAAGGVPSPALPDEDLLLALEGARAFADAEEMIARGSLREARELYLKRGDVHEAHPFAAERLLSLLVADPQAHELALDIASSLAQKREKSAAALWAEAVVRDRRGESARAAERFLALCTLARKSGEETSAFFAAESAARAARDQAPQMAVKALHELLGVRPDHLPSLQALARASDLARDRAGAIRAYRRIAALARDPAESAGAHVHLARLCALTEDDIAGARLHCEAALRLAPDQPDALYQLGELCHRAGEHLRAIKALDRLRDVALGRHEVDRVGRANLLAGRVWEAGLGQLENALLRFREAASLLPGEPEPLYCVARVAEKLGRLQEALAGYHQAIELAGPAPRADEARTAAHQSHHALARLYRSRLGDPARAREHLEAALALSPSDMTAIQELLPFFRAAGRALELAEACEKAAAATEEPSQRAAYWAEAGELYRGRLGKPDRAERLLSSALEADPLNRTALEGMLALAESRRDGGQLCRCLKALAQISSDPHDRARCYRRLSVAARDLAFDLDLAADALKQLLVIEPEDLPALGELCALQRRRADVGGLAAALERRAQVAEAQSDKRLASAALRELAQVLDVRLGRLGEALVALEKAARLSPDSAVLLDLADLSVRCDRPQHARRALEDLLTSLPANAAPERVADIRARLGRACEMLGDRDAARAQYAQAFAARRLDDELAASLEAIYQEGGQTHELVDLWSARAEALIAADRSDRAAPLLLKAARALLRLGDKETGSLRLSAALKAAPQGPYAGEILESLAELRLAHGDPREAASLLAKKAGLLDEPRAAAKLLLRAASLAKGALEERAFLEEALGRDPDFVPARMRRGELSIEDNPQAALQDFEAALTKSADDPDAPSLEERLDAARRAAFAALRCGQRQHARKHLAFYAAQRPGDLEVERELANLYRAAGDKSLLCDLLGELWPRLSGPERRDACREYAELARALDRTGASADALRTLLDAEPNDPWASRALYHLLPADGSSDPDERYRLLSVLIASTQGDERARYLAERAKLHRKAGRNDEARADLLSAASAPSIPGALLRELAEAAQEWGDAAAELAAWKLATGEPQLHAAAADRLLALSRSLMEQGEWEGAREGYSVCTGLQIADEARSVAFAGLADVLLALGQMVESASALREAARSGPPERRVTALLRSGAMLEDQRELAAAGECYEQALALSPASAPAASGLKRILCALQDWEGLAEMLAVEAARAPRPEAAALFEELGKLYADRLGQTGPAEAALRKAAQLDRENAPVRKRLAELLAGRGELLEAAAVMEEAAARLPATEGAELLRQVCQLARAQGDLELALALARKAHAVEPAAGRALQELADLLYLQGAVQEALPVYKAVAKQLDVADAPDVAEDVLLRLADLSEQSGDDALARQSLREVLALRPLCGAAAERLSRVLARDDPRQSIEVLRRYAGELQPSQQASRIFVDLANRARAELADIELASQLFQDALRASSDPLPVHRNLADLYRDSGRLQECRAQLLAIADLSAKAGDAQSAIDTYQQAASLSEQTGRVDDALDALRLARDLSLSQGDREGAASQERRRAALLREFKLDLPAAEAALEQSFEWAPQLETAQLGRVLSQQRADPKSEAAWLQRSIALHARTDDQAAAFFELAQLQAGPLSSRPEAESAAREALALDPGHSGAERLLTGILEAEGRISDLAAHYEEAAKRAREPADRARLFRLAADIYCNRVDQPDAAAAALLAAHAAAPDDLELTSQASELLRRAGREADAAEFDAVLLEADPMRPEVLERHLRFLEASGDQQRVAELMLRRAQRQPAESAAESYLQAAAAFRSAGAEQRALLCEDQAFASAPENERAFEAVCQRSHPDVRRIAETLGERASASPDRAEPLLRKRAELLADHGESLLAAEAYDDLLRVAPNDMVALSARAELAARSGGAPAAQPYDRRLLASGREALPLAVQVRTYLRLGHAALSSGALQDAADALQEVVAIEPYGEPGREALSLLSEVHARTGDARGLYQTTLALARAARPDEAEALYRRAADLFDQPQEAIDALLPLCQLRPAEIGIVQRAAQGLEALGRYGEVVDLYERSAQLTGGTWAAERLLDAAKLAADELHDGGRAVQLRQIARRLDPALSLQREFEPLMASAQYESALELADEANDGARSRRALWALAEKAESVRHADRLAVELFDEGAFGKLIRIAELYDRIGERAGAERWYRQLALGQAPLEVRAEALDRLRQRGQAEKAITDALAALGESAPPEWTEHLVKLARQMGGSIHMQALDRAAVALPSRAKAFLREMFELEREEKKLEAAVDTLDRLLQLEDDLRARAALHVEMGEIYLRGLDQPLRAREAFELALTEDLQCVLAVQRLVELSRGSDEPEQFVAMVERLGRLMGPEAIEGDREALSDAYQSLGRKQDALRVLSELEETPARLLRRAALSQELGMTAEALQLRERVSSDPDELQEILFAYLEVNQVAAAVRLATRLVDVGGLPKSQRRQLAERLAGSAQGAALAVSLWPDLLRDEPADPAGWKLFAEALRLVYRKEAAELAHGFEQALRGGAPDAAPVRIKPVASSSNRSFQSERPEALIPIFPESMPRLHASLSASLDALGAGTAKLFLDASGGVEAYLVGEHELVLGAGALGCFGPVELAYLSALALALGDRGRALSGAGAPEEMDQAACAAFEAVPSSQAAARVLAHLDEQVRGADPSQLNPLDVLRQNRAFHAVALKALSLV